MNFQSCTVNVFIVNVSFDNGVCQQVIRVFVALIVICVVLSKFILLVDNVNPLLLFCANISLQIFQDFVIKVPVIRVAIIWI